MVVNGVGSRCAYASVIPRLAFSEPQWPFLLLQFVAFIMDSDRRYSQKEIAAIFKKASEEQERIKEKSALEDGLSLADLHIIAKEAGISPDLITSAATGLEHEIEAPPEKLFLGIPISVHRIVDLKAPLSDEDWDKLVIDIRGAFGARGKVTREGGLREWSNGNLHILVEPTATGHRLRMGTEKGSAKGTFWASLSWIGVAIFIAIAASMAGDLSMRDLIPSIFFAIAGLGGIGFMSLHLSQWRYDRADQMDSIASKALNLVAKGGMRTMSQTLHEDIERNHEKDASHTAGLDNEFFDRTIESESPQPIEKHVRNTLLDVENEEPVGETSTKQGSRTRAQ